MLDWCLCCIRTGGKANNGGSGIIYQCILREELDQHYLRSYPNYHLPNFDDKHAYWADNRLKYNKSVKDTIKTKEIKKDLIKRHEWKYVVPACGLALALVVIQAPGFFHDLVHSGLTLLLLLALTIKLYGLSDERLWRDFHSKLGEFHIYVYMFIHLKKLIQLLCIIFIFYSLI